MSDLALNRLQGKVVAFFDSWPAKRKWAVDMAGFAVNLSYLAKYPNATMPYKAGYEEDAFLRSIDLKIDDIEPKANGCTEVYVWHTQTTKTKAPTVRISSDVLESTHTNLHALMKLLEEMGVSHTSSTGGEIKFLCHVHSMRKLLSCELLIVVDIT